MTCPTDPRPEVLSRWRVRVTVLACLLVLVCLSAQCAEVEILSDFETDAALTDWQFVSGTPRIVEEGATSGTHALEVTFDPKAQYQAAYLYWNRVPSDWSPYDALVLDVTNPGDRPLAGYLLVADKAWEDKNRSYWNRHNGSTSFPPGHSEWTIPVRGLYRGEAGGRNPDIARNIDPDSIVRMDIGFGSKGDTGRVLIDSIRFVKADRPADVWAFDFGPPSQSTMLGWTPVSHDTVYSADQGFGWGPQGGSPWDGADRDNTFGTSLIQDFCEAGGYNFRIDVPPGEYRCTVIYENSGYWGGEQARQSERRILANGQLAWSETRPDGAAHALYRFEDVEPIGVDIWDTYMADELAKSVDFTGVSIGDGITLRFEADLTWGSKISALVIRRAGDDAADAWVAQQMDAVASEFRRKAQCLDAPAPEFEVPDAWSSAPVLAWACRIEDTITPNSTPRELPATPGDLSLSRVAVRGEFEPFCVALRPQKDLGECQLALEATGGPGELPATVGVVHYNTSRGFGDIAYRVAPHTLRVQDRVSLPADVSREIIVTVRVPEDAEEGGYTWALLVQDAAEETLLRVPMTLRVHPVTLSRETDYLTGFFGLMPPSLIPSEDRWDVLEQTLALLRDHGANAVSGGPNWTLKGWQNGEPQIDFGEMDRFFALLREYGFDKSINGYGGERFNGLAQGYQKGSVGEKVEQDSGLTYREAMMRAWKAVDEHARANNWPTIYYAMCDETRVKETAESELEFMKLMAEVSAAFPQTVRASGAYSVDFRTRPTDVEDMLYWHQRFFEVLDVSSLNGHDETVLEEATRQGKEIHIYNQGRTRYSFGLYQWSEYQKGVAARWQWHLNVLHGYQFFDLDGREPDTAMLCYGRETIYPTIHFERCREGAEDFYLYQTLASLIEQQPVRGEADATTTAAQKLLDDLTGSVAVNQRGAPAGHDADAVKAKLIAAIESLNRD